MEKNMREMYDENKNLVDWMAEIHDVVHFQVLRDSI
jgi:hypothetical protein